MTIQYNVTEEDIQILKRRVEYPCVYAKCSRAGDPKDYGYLGCGCQSTCERRLRWDKWWEEVEKAGLNKLAEDVAQLDKLYAQRQKITSQMTGVLAGINNRMGMKIMNQVNNELFSGQL